MEIPPDIAEKVFGDLPISSLLQCRKMRANLGVCKDSIFVSRHVDLDYAMELWMMKDYGVVGSWTKVLVLQNEFDCKGFYYLKVVKFLENGDLLLFNGHSLILYNPRNKVYSKLDIPQQIDLIHDKKEFDIIGFRPSFASLKDMVGDNLKVLKASSNK